MNTRKRSVATVATHPATQSPLIGGDHEASFFDLLFRQYRRRTVRQLEHWIRERLLRIRWTHRIPGRSSTSAGVQERLKLTRNRMRVLWVSCPEVSPVLIGTREHVRYVRVPPERTRIGRSFGLSHEQRVRSGPSLRGRRGRRDLDAGPERITFGNGNSSRYRKVSLLVRGEVSNPLSECVPCRWEQTTDKIVNEFPVPKYVAAFARCFRYPVCKLVFVLVGLLPGIRYLLVGSL